PVALATAAASAQHMGNIIADELKGVMPTVIGFVRQVFMFIWSWMQHVWSQVMDDPWKLAHLSVTTAILFS
ncbi:hypothetical protein KAX02_08920, partial [candidate division WOR-3 bacterium]|nr:hypothetical protein [candidate division WOR-3 bacterium]